MDLKKGRKLWKFIIAKMELEFYLIKSLQKAFVLC